MQLRKLGLAFASFLLPLSFSQALEAVSIYGQIKYAITEQAENFVQVDGTSCAESRNSMGFSDDIPCKVSGAVVASELSYFGVKGGLELGGGLEAFYAGEVQFAFADQAYYGLRNSAYSGQSLSARNVYVGLRDLWGELFIGRNDSVLKMAQGQVDLFNLQPGGIDDIFAGEIRRDQILNYFSPQWSMFQFGFSLVSSQDPTQAKPVTYSASGTPDLPMMGYAAMIRFGDPALKDHSYHVALALSKDLAEIEQRMTLTAESSQGQSGVLNRDVLRFSAQAKFWSLRLGMMYQYQTYADKHLENKQVWVKGRPTAVSASVLNNDQHNFLLSTGYQIADTEIKLQWVHSDLESNIYSVGGDYFLESKFKVYFYYTTRYDALMLNETGSNTAYYEVDYNSISLGFEYKF
jgi:hypothetical protein